MIGAVCYQGITQRLLPDELKNETPLRIRRFVNVDRTKDSIIQNDLFEN